MNSKLRLKNTIRKISQLPNRNRNAYKSIYYTQVEVMETGCKWLKSYVDDPVKLLDFSAGNGALGGILKKHIPNAEYFPFDIQPTHESVTQCDFLETRVTCHPDVIGFNPPFGREGRIALQFLEQALTYKPKYILVILPLRPWLFNNIVVKQRVILTADSFYTIEDDKPFSTASEMLLLECDYSNGNPEIGERKVFPFTVTDTRKKEFEGEQFQGSMILLRKVGWYAGQQAYVVSRNMEPDKNNKEYIVNYISKNGVEPSECFSNYGVIWPTSVTPWGKRGHIVCYKDEAVDSSRGGQGFLKLYFQKDIDHQHAERIGKKLVEIFCERDLAFGSPKSINCAIVRSVLLTIWRPLE